MLLGVGCLSALHHKRCYMELASHSGVRLGSGLGSKAKNDHVTRLSC